MGTNKESQLKELKGWSKAQFAEYTTIEGVEEMKCQMAFCLYKGHPNLPKDWNKEMGFELLMTFVNINPKINSQVIQFTDWIIKNNVDESTIGVVMIGTNHKKKPQKTDKTQFNYNFNADDMWLFRKS
jgi:hypothetical protein